MDLAMKLRAMSTDDAMRLVAQLRPQFFAKVAALRSEHLQGKGSLSAKSTDSYREDARRVDEAGGDPLKLAGTSASFRKLRAACRWQAREQLSEVLARADRLRKKGNDLASLCVYADELPRIEARLAFLDGVRFDPSKAERRCRTKMQRHKLGRLPDDWIVRMHRRTKGGKYGHAVALGALIPVRPDEIASRVRVKLEADGSLLFEVKGSKVRESGSGVAAHVEGIGQTLRQVRLSEVDSSRKEVFEWLKSEIQTNGGKLSIGPGLSASGISSAFSAASRREFSGLSSPPSFYAMRHAACAELKSSGIGAQDVAKGMGHASELSQKVYGTPAQGSGGYVVQTWASDSVRSARPTTGPPARPRAKAGPPAAPMRSRGPRGP